MGLDKVCRQHVFIIGSKGIPAAYGGFETFVENLVKKQSNSKIQYHVACSSEPDAVDLSKANFKYYGANCFTIPFMKVGSARAIVYDIDSLRYSIAYIKKNQIMHPIIYILACRIGPFIGYYKKQIEKLGGKLYVNPDGHEWKRQKWSKPVRAYWKLSERLMVKHANLLVCDSKNIEKYIKEDYKKYNPETTYIAYGADISKSVLLDDDEKIVSWNKEKQIFKKNYYLVVGRFVPENNFEIMIREFMASKTDKDLVIITTLNPDFMAKLENKFQMSEDKRIKFVGTVYDADLLKKIRENAYGYLHGHEVGGTNPSLLEALGSTDLNLLLDVGFNKEVAEESALYWNKENNNLAKLIESSDEMSNEQILLLSKEAKRRINSNYSWNFISSRYEELFH